MKNQILNIMALTLVGTGTFAQNVNIPDANFKAYLVGNTNINTNSDTEIQISEAAAFNGLIDCGYLGITDFTGIEAFTALTELKCYGNNMSILDVSQNTALEYIHCGYCGQLGTLVTGANSALTDVLTTDNTSLYIVDFTQNPSLINLYLGQNDLASLDVTQNTALVNLVIDFNHVSSIDLSQNTALTTFSCYDNSLNSLDLTANTAIQFLNCSNNNLSALDISPCPDLYNFSCSNNNLTVLDLTNNADLIYVYCNGNNITQLDASASPLLELFHCYSNDLTSLNMKNLSTSVLNYFDATLNPNLTCIEVDDVTGAATNWTDIDATASFSLTCSFAGINETVRYEEITIFPNPAQDHFTVSGIKESASYQLVNATGEIVLSGTVQPSEEINIETLTKGVYFLHLNHSSVVKLIRE